MGRKSLKRKLGKKVLAGKLTVDEARARLGRNVAQKSAWSTWSEQAPACQPRPPDEDYLLAAVRAPMPRPAAVVKNRKTAPAGPSPRQLLTKAVSDARTWDICNQLPPVAVKQLSSVEGAMAAELRRQLAVVEYDPAKAEAIRSQIAGITGLMFK